jgi:HAMP domain-containing protein
MIQTDRASCFTAAVRAIEEHTAFLAAKNLQDDLKDAKAEVEALRRENNRLRDSLALIRDAQGS